MPTWDNVYWQILCCSYTCIHISRQFTHEWTPSCCWYAKKREKKKNRVCVHVFLSVCRFILDRRPFHPFVTDDQPTNNGGSWVIPSSSFGTFGNLPLFSICAVWNLDRKSWLLWQPNWGVTGRDCSSFEIFWCEARAIVRAGQRWYYVLLVDDFEIAVGCTVL